MTPLDDGTPLPALREELRLEPATADHDGAPRWRFHDPLRHRNFLIGDDDVKLLSLWSCGSVGALRHSLAEGGVTLDLRRLGELIAFLENNFLVQPKIDGGGAALFRTASTRESTGPMWLLQRYMGMRFALWHPQAFLRAALPFVTVLHSRTVVAAWTLATLLGFFLVAPQWDQFVGTFKEFLTPGGVLGYGVVLIALKCIHELGHAFAATWQGCRVGSMGVSVIMGMPMLYTETTDASRLPRRGQRMWIAAGGVLAESVVAGLATLAWAVLPDGTARSIAFVLATSSWLMTLTINLNPFSRFDGYYFVSDALGIENLQSRALAYAGWACGRLLFGSIEAPPEALTRRRALGFGAYGSLVWLYRLGLYTGMAALAYTFLFKAAGVLVMAFELWVFVVKPLLRKGGRWWSLRARVTERRRLVLLGAGCASALLLVAPFDRGVTVPVMLTWQHETVLQSPENARVLEMMIRPGQTVTAGQVLLRLESPELAIKRASARIHRLSAGERLDRISGDARDRAESTVLARERNEADADLQGLADRAALLELRAPEDGVVVDVPANLQAGQWVRPDQVLARVLHGTARDARGFVTERELARLRPGAGGRFVPEDPAIRSMPVSLVTAEPDAAEQIAPAPLSSLHGGTIATQADAKNREVPVVAQHRVRFVVEDRTTGARHGSSSTLPVSLRGEVRVDARPQSLLDQAGRQLWHLLIMELRD